MLRPMALAVFKLIANSNFVGCSNRNVRRGRPRKTRNGRAPPGAGPSVMSSSFRAAYSSSGVRPGSPGSCR